MVTRHFGICCHHQLNVARVGEETFASARGYGMCAGGVVVINVLIIYRGSERVQLFSHIPSALKRNWPLGILCFKREK